MALSGLLRGYWRQAAGKRLERRLSTEAPKQTLERSTWEQSLQDPTGFYLDCVRFFHQKLPREYVEHRAYFHNVSGNRRGYGENAFHVLWYLLFQQFKPATFLEIGVFRGQTLSLAALWAKITGNACEVWGISPFSTAGDSVSKYRQQLDYYHDTLANFDHFRLPHPNLLRAFSTDPEAAQLIKSRAWAMIYIDGNHDYEVASKDWEVCSQSLALGGIVVLDDASLNTAFGPPPIASGGHPGPSRIAAEVSPQYFREILRVGHNRAFQKVSG